MPQPELQVLPPSPFANHPDMLHQDIMSHTRVVWAETLANAPAEPDIERQSHCLVVATRLEGEGSTEQPPYAAAAVTVAMWDGDNIKLALDRKPKEGATLTAIREKWRKRDGPVRIVVSLASLAMAEEYNDFVGGTSGHDLPNGDKLGESELRTAMFEDPKHPGMQELILPDARWSAVYEVTGVRNNNKITQWFLGLLPGTPMHKRMQKASRAVVRARLVSLSINPDRPPALLYGGRKDMDVQTSENGTEVVSMRQYVSPDGTELLLPAKSE